MSETWKQIFFWILMFLICLIFWGYGHKLGQAADFYVAPTGVAPLASSTYSNPAQWSGKIESMSNGDTWNFVVDAGYIFSISESSTITADDAIIRGVAIADGTTAATAEIMLTTGRNTGFIFSAANGTIVQDLKFYTSFDSEGDHAIELGNGTYPHLSDVTIRRCEFTGNGIGRAIDILRSASNTIEHCVMNGLGGGIQAYYINDKHFIMNNRISYNDLNNIAMTGIRISSVSGAYPCGYNTIEYNTVGLVNNVTPWTGDAIYLQWATNCIVAHNYVANTSSPTESAGTREGSGISFQEVQNSTCEWNVFYNNYIGLELWGGISPNYIACTTNTIRYNNFGQTHGSADRQFGNTSGNTSSYSNRIYGNFFGPNSSRGIFATQVDANNGLYNDVYHNVLYGQNVGVSFGAATINGFRFYNNIFYDQLTYCMGISFGGSFITRNNLYYKSAGGTLISASGTTFTAATITTLDPLAKTTNPDFVNPPSDLHLQTGSVAHDSGTTLVTSLFNLTTDRDGNPFVGNPDIGMYEIPGFENPSWNTPDWIQSGILGIPSTLYVNDPVTLNIPSSATQIVSTGTDDLSVIIYQNNKFIQSASSVTTEATVQHFDNDSWVLFPIQITPTETGNLSIAASYRGNDGAIYKAYNSAAIVNNDEAVADNVITENGFSPQNIYVEYTNDGQRFLNVSGLSYSSQTPEVVMRLTEPTAGSELLVGNYNVPDLSDSFSYYNYEYSNTILGVTPTMHVFKHTFASGYNPGNLYLSGLVYSGSSARAFGGYIKLATPLTVDTTGLASAANLATLSTKVDILSSSTEIYTASQALGVLTDRYVMYLPLREIDTLSGGAVSDATLFYVPDSTGAYIGADVYHGSQRKSYIWSYDQSTGLKGSFEASHIIKTASTVGQWLDQLGMVEGVDYMVSP